jgi:hypothetical protein
MSTGRAYDAVIATLQDLSFNVDLSDPENGLIVAGRDTEVEQAAIARFFDRLNQVTGVSGEERCSLRLAE